MRHANAAYIAFLFGTAPLLAQTGRPPADDRTARLERAIEAQQQRLADLQHALAASASQDVDATRNEALKAQIRGVLGAREFRERLVASTAQAGYDGGFYVRSADEKFEMKFKGLMQIRWDYYEARATNRYRNPGAQRDDRTGFEMARIRFDVEGRVFSKDLTYRIEFRSDAGTRYDTAIQYAYLNYRFREEFQVRAGVFRLASTRAQVNAAGRQQFIDRPPVDAVFGLGVGQGVRFWGRLFDRRVEYFFDVANSLNNEDDRVIAPDPSELDPNPALLFRLVWHVIGDDPARDFRNSADLPRHRSPALDLGFHYAFNEDDGDAGSTRTVFPLVRGGGQGGLGVTTTQGLQINQFGWDAAFKYLGFSLTGEYVVRLVDVRRGDSRPFAPRYLLTGDGATVADQGAYVQAGYLLPLPGLEDRLEAVARVGGVSTLGGGQEGTWEYAGGLNYYLAGDAAKLQFDVTKISEAPRSSSPTGLANANDDALLFRVQLQLAF